MSRKLMLAAAAAVTLSVGGLAWAQGAAPSYVTAAVADAGRPAADVERDAARKPAEMLVFAGVKPGEVVGEMLPGGGYFTRILSKAVGPKGKVYAVVLPSSDGKAPPVAAIAADPAYSNVKVVSQDLTQLNLPEKVDLIWTSQNYHDMHIPKYASDVNLVNKAAFAALKPGGVYLVLDHAAAAGAPVAETANTLHRIDPAAVRREVEAAGFKYEGESNALRNPADNHTLRVFDPSLRGHTDQFVYKFRKPR